MAGRGLVDECATAVKTSCYLGTPDSWCVGRLVPRRPAPHLHLHLGFPIGPALDVVLLDLS